MGTAPAVTNRPSAVGGIQAAVVISGISEIPKEGVRVLGECKALANETRLSILDWLKDPPAHFPVEDDTAGLGVCVGLIQQKTGSSASTVSAHLAILQRAGFLVATKRGQWTYYRRDEARIRAFTERLHSVL